jgi:hypothetical protein
MFVGLIAGLAIDRADLALSGDSFLQMILDVVLSEPAFRAAGDGECAGHGDEQQNALHPLILGSKRCIAIADIGREVDRINRISQNSLLISAR